MATYSSEVLADSPAQYLKLDETSGSTAADSSGNGRDAGYFGSVTLGQSSLLGDGSGTSVALANPAHVGMAGASWMELDDVTVEARVRPDAAVLSNGGFIASRWGSGAFGARQWLWGVTSAAKLTVTLRTSAGDYTVTGSTSLVAGTDYTVAARWSYTTGTLSVVLNGTVDGSVTITGGRSGVSSEEFALGRAAASDGAGLTWTGRIDEFSFTPAYLSDARLAARHAAAVAAGSTTTTGSGTATAPTPAASGTGTTTTTGSGTATAPTPTASGTGTAPGAPTTGSGTATAPTPTASGTGTAPAGPTTGSGTATVPLPTPSGTGDTGEIEGVVTVIDVIDVDGFVTVTLTPAAELPGTVPVLRESYVMPPLTEADPVYQPRVDYPAIREEVCTVHLWIGGVDVTYFRGVPTEIKRWDSEAPFGDKTAAWEMPQLEPWERPGVGDLAFMRKDAKVVIGYVSPLGVVTEEWVGFYHSRSRNVGDSRSSLFEAKGEMWAAMHMVHEPLPYMPPTDIGIVIPRLLNRLPGRRFPLVREVITGIKTRTRGARDQWVWQVVQDIFAEAWTDDGRQWTLHRGQLALKKPMTVVDAEVAWGTPLVDIDLVVDEDSRVDGIFARGKTKGGGEWANVYYPGAHILTPPPFPNTDASNINIGTTDAMTDSGTGVSDWQRKVNALGRWGRLAVDGSFDLTDSRVLREIQDDLGLTVDGSLGPQSWEGTFGAGRESIDLTPIRLPLVVKPTAWPTLHDSHGVNLGPNPQFDETIVPHFIPLDLGTNITRAQGRAACKTYLAIHGEASCTGSVEFIGDPNNIDRTKLGVGDNLRVTGLEGRPVVVQFASKSCELDGDGDGKQLIVRFDFDERARDALTLEQILQRNRDAMPDPARRPGNPNRQSRNVQDEGYSWDEESPCGELERVAVNGASGLWTVRTIPVAEFGSLASIILESDHPFAMAIFANTRITPNVLRSLVGNPFASTDPFRPHMPELERTWGLVEAWGAQDDACGYSPLTEKDTGATFTGDFVFKNDLEYVTDGLPYLSFAFYFRGGSGFVDGRARPARNAG